MSSIIVRDFFIYSYICPQYIEVYNIKSTLCSIFLFTVILISVIYNTIKVMGIKENENKKYLYSRF